MDALGFIVAVLMIAFGIWVIQDNYKSIRASWRNGERTQPIIIMFTSGIVLFFVGVFSWVIISRAFEMLF